MGGGGPLQCPICGCVWQERRHEWRKALAAPDRVAGWLWLHKRPDNGKPCPYIDGGATVHPAPPAARVAARVGEEQRAV